MNTDLKGTVKCPSSYFKKMAMVDYSNWKTALAREFFQNSIDAGSKRIDVSFDIPNSIVSVKDNGCGMTLDIILNKLLVLGGSHKQEGSVGAFGKAKELLYFSWPSWSIETGNTFISGEGPDYSISKNTKKVKGVESKIYIDEDFPTVIHAFKEVAGKMDTSSKIYVDGQRVKPSMKKGSLIKSFDFGDLYWNKSGRSNTVSYRINGIWMFDYYVGIGKGKFTFDMTKSSLDLLTSNRDDLQWSYRHKVQDLVNSISVNRETMTKTSYTILKEYFYSGYGTVGTLSSTTTGSLVNTVPINSNVPLNNDVEKVNSYNSLPKVKGFDKDFAVIFTSRGRSKAKYFLKQKRAATILKIWDGIIQQILDDNKLQYPYMVGLTFDPNTAACISNDGMGRYEIYINPNDIGKNMPNPKRIMSNRLFLVEDLKDKAIHEVSHIFESAHNETFVLKMHKLRAGTIKNLKKYNKIGRIR